MSVIVVGVGPGLGGALARRFAQEGLTVGLVARHADKLEAIAADIDGQTAIAAADAGDPDAVAAAHAALTEALGPAEVLIYNASGFLRGGILELDPSAFVDTWKGGPLGALLWAQQVLPGMVERKRGTVLISGATGSLRGGANFAGFAVGKFGLRALGQSMAREFGPQGIHVCHVVIDGQIDTPQMRQWMPDREAHTLLQPAAMADVYWQIHTQHPTTWTQELDLRPAVEKF